MQSAKTNAVADAQTNNWVDLYAPEPIKPYARLARWDRPIGFWLLFWPCAFGLTLAALANPHIGVNFYFMALMFIGAILMRGAGCTFNDIVDKDIDIKVARTRSRPIASGSVSRRQAGLFLIAQALLGFAVLVQFNALSIGLGIGSLILVAIYPFMKRVTWWPQAFLGLAFSWGALMGWTAQTGTLSFAPLALYLGSICWTIGYDSLYALQDIEDDALIGVKSTARLFGQHARPIISLFYGLTVFFWGLAIVLAGGNWLGLLGLLVPLALMAWQLATLNAQKPGNALARFKNNHWVGLAFTLVLLADVMW